MGFDDYKVVLYRQDDGSWVAEIPALGGCYALMDTREAAPDLTLKTRLLPREPPQSVRNARNGSIPRARRAGSHAAIATARTKTPMAAAYVVGSR